LRALVPKLLLGHALVCEGPPSTVSKATKDHQSYDVPSTPSAASAKQSFEDIGIPEQELGNEREIQIAWVDRALRSAMGRRIAASPPIFSHRLGTSRSTFAYSAFETNAAAESPLRARTHSRLRPCCPAPLRMTGMHWALALRAGRNLDQRRRATLLRDLTSQALGMAKQMRPAPARSQEKFHQGGR